MKVKNVLIFTISLAVIPIVTVFVSVFFGKTSYILLSALIAVLSCVPFFMSFEKEKSTRRIVLLAVMVAIAAAGRFVFAPLQFFKPICAIVIISGICFGAEFGFLTGSLSALISNFYFGQGPWTPFQMFALGVIGFFAGILCSKLSKNRALLLSYGVFSGILYSFLMDIWTVLSVDGGEWRLSRYLAAIVSAVPVTAVYSVSNVVFLFILTPIFIKKTDRLKTKYGL